MARGFSTPGKVFTFTKFIGFILLIIGAFAVLKLYGLVPEDLFFSNDLTPLLVSLACMLIGAILMFRKEGLY